MITKFKNIKNLAVFKNFDWDNNLRNQRNEVVLFKRINILYGRNYSGKTTLSRIVRALETGAISNKYENPECSICITDNDDVTQLDFTNHDKIIRVFNEDFIDDNLKFIVNPDENIEPFAILGEGNNEIEEEIEQLKTKLGSNEEDSETGLYQDLKSLTAIYNIAKKSHFDAQNSLDSQLSSKATGQPNGIKYQSIYGEVNYDIRRLKTDILVVKEATYTPLTNEEKLETETILREQAKDEILALEDLTLTFSDLSTKTKDIVTREIGQSNKIQSLLKDAVLNRWVKKGRQLHINKLNTCAFCDNQISENRWSELEKHFDEESDQLEKDINSLLVEIRNEKTQSTNYQVFTKDKVYSKFHNELESLSQTFNNEVKNYSNSLKLLEEQLENRKKDILNAQLYTDVVNYTEEVVQAKGKLEELRTNSNEYTDKLNSDQSEARGNLRLKEVYDFINDIKHDDLKTNIESLKTKEEEEKSKRDLKQKEIDEIISQISSKQKELKDESKGAEKVNEYLSNHFGHNFLTLNAIEVEDEETGNKNYRFEIHREGKRAYHLSEGEKSLIAFCYYVAKLEDVDTKAKSPIIWIDDPISSLDNNHIFFIYSIIKSQIYNNRDFEQIFISTHNLNFLKYLKRLPSHGDNENDRVRHFLIERIENTSLIKEMPKYIKNNITEFNHLFKQIIECSSIESITDDNYTVFYNFGNNTRKFLEIFLFYKYPDSSNDLDKMKKFFGNEEIPAILTDRINNEYSHLAGIFERGQQPVEVPEMKNTAKLIIDKIKEHDEEQFNALTRSIGYQNQ